MTSVAGMGSQAVERDSEGLEELIPGYLRNRHADLQTLAEALGRGDYDAMRILGHNMKGTGSGYGFAEISDIGKDLEAAAKERSNDGLRAQISNLSEFLKRVPVG
jgi:HPt (histidine-containing phosphotransfer) domain-containing protein